MIVSFAFLCLFTGIASAEGPSPTMERQARYAETQLRLYSGRRLDCAAKYLTVEQVELFAWKVYGCDRELSVHYTTSKGFLSDVDVRHRAPFDLDCPADDVSVVFLGRYARGVEGCGRRATYVYRDGWYLDVLSDGLDVEVRGQGSPGLQGGGVLESSGGQSD